MEEIIITGGQRLQGELTVQGAKNSALPILAAAAAVDGISVIHNCPDLTDVSAAIGILEYLGCRVSREEETVTVDARDITRWDIPEHLMHEMRSSIVFLGPLLSRFGKADVSTPGGCEIGLRPIDLHRSAMERFGVKIHEEGSHLRCLSAERLVGTEISLMLPSVGATENIMLAAATAVGKTTVFNAAREPEIVDLAGFLNACGANVKGAGGSTIVIEGIKKLHGTQYRVIPDRIVTATYMAAAAVTQGDIQLRGVIPEHILPVISTYEDTGCRIDWDTGNLRIQAPKRLFRFRTVRTQPYPGFPTDAQATAMAMACVARGTSMIIETIFENRYNQAADLCRMGAEIEISGRMAVIEGVHHLHGASVRATDLRGGAALVVAGLAAEGTTRITDVHLIDRGCQNIEENLASLGARIRREERHGDTTETGTGHTKASAAR